MYDPTPPLRDAQQQIATTILVAVLALGCNGTPTQGSAAGTSGAGASDAKASSTTTTGSSVASTAFNSNLGGARHSTSASVNGSSPLSSTLGGFDQGGALSTSSGGTSSGSGAAPTSQAPNQGGATAKSGTTSRGGTSPRGSSSSRGGTSSATSAANKGGATSPTSPAKGGVNATGGRSSSASSSTIGGGTANGGASASGGSAAGGNDQCHVGKWDGKTKPVPLTLSGSTFAHDPTMIFADGTYYRFWTGDNIPSAKSTNLTNWQNASAVFKNGYSDWVDEWLAGISGETFNFPWAPDVSYFDGKYHIYSTFSAKFGDNISCITHLTTADIAAANWTDHGPVICTKGNENYNAIDADLGLDASGAPWLAFGSFWDGIMGMPLNPDGSSAGNKLTRLARANEIEAPVLFYRCGYYYLFVTWGLCCPGEGRSVSQLTYRVAVGRSRDIMGPYVDRSGKSMLDGGGTLMVQGDKTTWAAAGHSDVVVSGDKIYHLYHAYRQSNGEAQLRIVEMPFDAEQWPVPAGP